VKLWDAFWRLYLLSRGGAAILALPCRAPQRGIVSTAILLTKELCSNFLLNSYSIGGHANDKVRAYISALATRYTPEPVEDRSELDPAYANAMRQVAQQYPDDPDAATLFAEALMDTTPWDYGRSTGWLKVYRLKVKPLKLKKYSNGLSKPGDTPIFR
jgi:hypothetical protein